MSAINPRPEEGPSTIRTARAMSLTRSHPNGTRYRLLVVEDPDGGLEVSWPAARWARWAGWASEHIGGEIRSYAKRPSKPDLEAIGEVLDEARRILAGVGR